MRIFSLQPKARYFIVLATIAFFLVGFLGLGQFSMGTDTNREMLSCPFMGVTALCQMGLLEHIATWQNMFTNLPVKNVFNFLALLLFFFLLVFSLRNFRGVHRNVPLCSRINIFGIGKPTFRGFLQEAFSDGILNPRLF